MHKELRENTPLAVLTHKPDRNPCRPVSYLPTTPRGLGAHGLWGIITVLTDARAKADNPNRGTVASAAHGEATKELVPKGLSLGLRSIQGSKGASNEANFRLNNSSTQS